jgi:uncharacterized protein YbcI
MNPPVAIPGEVRKALAKEISIAHRRVCNRGPCAVKVDQSGDLVTITLDGFMTPYEEKLATAEDCHALIAVMRRGLLTLMREEWANLFRECTGLVVKQLDGHVDVKRNRRVITVRVAAE